MIRTNLQTLRVALMILATLAIGLFAISTCSVFAQSSGAWTTMGSLNPPGAGHTTTLLLNGQVLVVGGEDATGVLASAELYNPANGKWTSAGSMSTPRINHSAGGEHPQASRSELLSRVSA